MMIIYVRNYDGIIIAFKEFYVNVQLYEKIRLFAP